MKLLEFIDRYIEEQRAREAQEYDPQVKLFLNGGIAALVALRDLVFLGWPDTELQFKDTPTVVDPYVPMYPRLLTGMRRMLADIVRRWKKGQ